MAMKKSEFPQGWNETRVQELLSHYENQTDEEAAAEHEAALSRQDETAFEFQAMRQGAGRMGKNQHVVPHGKAWAVKGEGNSKATSVHGTQREAIEAAREIAKNQHSELLVHGRDGEIRERDSHGHDPFPPKG